MGRKAAIRVAAGLAAGSVARVIARSAAGLIIRPVVRAVAVIGEEIIKDKEGEIWDEEALDTLFNETIQYSVVNNYVFVITELYT